MTFEKEDKKKKTGLFLSLGFNDIHSDQLAAPRGSLFERVTQSSWRVTCTQKAGPHVSHESCLWFFPSEKHVMRPSGIGRLGSGHLTADQLHWERLILQTVEAECSTGAALPVTSFTESKAMGSSRDLLQPRRLLRKLLSLNDFFVCFFFFCSLAGDELGKEQRWRSKCIDVLISWWCHLASAHNFPSSQQLLLTKVGFLLAAAVSLHARSTLALYLCVSVF